MYRWFLVPLLLLVIGCSSTTTISKSQSYPDKDKGEEVFVSESKGKSSVDVEFVNFGALLVVSLNDDLEGYSWHLHSPATGACSLVDKKETRLLDGQGDYIKLTKFYFICYDWNNLVFDYHKGDKVIRSFAVKVTRKPQKLRKGS